MAAAADFSDNYRTARARFVRAVADLGWRHEVYPIDAGGPDGEALTIDVGIGGADSSSRCLVVSSGLHGVEAFFGSALQLALLKLWHANPSALPALRVVFIHALNPYGFAWLRRADQDNIDLNRNFLPAGERYVGSPLGYAELDSLLNPKRPPARCDGFLLQTARRIARDGLTTLQRAIVGGQYDFPQGLFYGGAQASRTMQIVARHLPDWLGASARVLHLDLHSGLGKWGSYKLLIDYALKDSQRDLLRASFGAATFEENAAHAVPSSVGYPTLGGFGQWCVTTHHARDYLFAYAEFGAYHIVRTLAALRAENQAHFWGHAEDASTLRAKLRLKERLGPASRGWRERVLARGVDLVLRAGQALLRAR